MLGSCQGQALLLAGQSLEFLNRPLLVLSGTLGLLSSKGY